MSAPLTTRDALAEALAQHEPWGGGAFCYCLPTDDEGRSEPLPGSWEQHLADALLASGALIDATKLAEDEALVERVNARTDVTRWSVVDVLTALAAALSAQSERAEVER